MDHVVGRVVRRGVEAYNGASEPIDLEMPTWGIAMLALTVVGFAATYVMIEYTYGQVVATLTMVESANTAVLQPIPSEDPDAPLDEKKEPEMKLLEPEMLLVKQQPITAKFRTTIQHLNTRAGRLSRFRGIFLWWINQSLTGHLTMLFSAIEVPMGVDYVLAAIIASRLSLCWTHIVMSEPSEKYWFQRLLSLKAWSKVAIPTAILALAKQITLGLPTIFFYALHYDELTQETLAEMSHCQRSMIAMKMLTLVALGLFSAVAIVVPARVALTRVQASLLSESEEPIVPFDRSFGGKFVPTELGGTGVISMLEAWKTFDWNSRVRILGVYTKVAGMQVALTIAALFVFAAELNFITGMAPSTVVATISKKM